MTFPTEDMPLTHIPVVVDVERSRRWYSEVLGAELHREYGGEPSRHHAACNPSHEYPAPDAFNRVVLDFLARH